MKIFRPMIVFVTLILLYSHTISAGTVGDVNNDGKIDLTEAIYALQVVSGSVEPTEIILNMVILIDQSGSMVSDNKWVDTKNGLSEFFVASSSVGIRVAINFYPVQGAVDQCDASEYNPIQVPLGDLTDYSIPLISELENKTPAGSSPLYPAMYGSLVVATNFKDSNFDAGHDIIVVLVSDGDPSQCNTNIDDIAGLAQSAFNYNGVRTYTIALSGANMNNLSTIAASGGTNQAYDVTADTSLIKTKLDQIVTHALEPYQ